MQAVGWITVLKSFATKRERSNPEQL